MIDSSKNCYVDKPEILETPRKRLRIFIRPESSGGNSESLQSAESSIAPSEQSNEISSISSALTARSSVSVQTEALWSAPRPSNIPLFPAYLVTGLFSMWWKRKKYAWSVYCYRLWYYEIFNSSRSNLTVPEFDLDCRESKFIILSESFVRGSGIGREDDDTHLFMREACWRQISFILDSVVRDKKLGAIYGQPGTGKSLITYSVGGFLSRSAWTVIWLHVDRETSSYITCVVMNGAGKMVGKVAVSEALLFLDVCCKRFPGKHLAIIDGVTNDPTWIPLLDSARIWWGTDPESRRLIQVFSMAVMGKLSDNESFKYRKTPFMQYSWTLAEYRAAMNDSDFAQSVGRFLDAGSSPWTTDKLACKYYFAGGCARYMFHRTTACVVSSIRNAIDSLGDIESANDLTTGILSKRASHRLVSVFPDSRREIVSEFAGLEMALILGQQKIYHLANHPLFSCNPSLNGGFLEIFFFALAKAGRIVLYSKAGKKVVWLSEPRASFFQPEAPNLGSCVPNQWLIPNKWNQPGYDGVYLHESSATKKRVIRFVQITRSESHDLKLAHFAQLIKLLKKIDVFDAQAVEIFFVVPDINLSCFKIKKIESPEALSDFGWPTTDEEIRAFIPVLGLDFSSQRNLSVKKFRRRKT